MKDMWDKLCEITQHFWLKLAMTVPVGLFMIEERERIMIVALLVVITIDCIFGAFLAWMHGKFQWSKLGKKFSKKFLLYFFTLAASFIIHNAFKDILEWWFYTIGSIVTLSEFGSLMNKSNALGFPVGGDIFVALSEKMKCKIWQFCGVRLQTPKRRKDDF